MRAQVTVAPEEFRFVAYDAAAIAGVVGEMAGQLGIERPIRVEIDETTPLARTRVEMGDTLVIRVESGALENSQRPRTFGDRTARTNLGRALLRARDRLSGGFDEAPAYEDLSLQETAAWDTYCVGRLGRLGVDVNQQRWRYNFRNRFGFSDGTDAAFDAVWAADDLTWARLQAMAGGR